MAQNGGEGAAMAEACGNHGGGAATQDEDYESVVSDNSGPIREFIVSATTADEALTRPIIPQFGSQWNLTGIGDCLVVDVAASPLTVKRTRWVVRATYSPIEDDNSTRIAAVQRDGQRIEYVDQTRLTKRQEIAAILLPWMIHWTGSEMDQQRSISVSRALGWADELLKQTEGETGDKARYDAAINN